MATYLRTAGDHVAERVRPRPGTDDAARLEELVADPESGWRRADELEGSGPPVSDPSDPSAPFDPGEHSVVEVLAYLGEKLTDPDEQDRVLAAEEAGKARKSVLVAREALAARRGRQEE